MAWLTIITKIPWKEIAKFAPTILDTAIKINKSVQKHLLRGNINPLNTNNISNENSKNIMERIKSLEENEIEQSELVKNMATQLSKLSNAAEILSKRIILAMVISGLSIILTIIMIVIKIH